MKLPGCPWAVKCAKKSAVASATTENGEKCMNKLLAVAILAIAATAAQFASAQGSAADVTDMQALRDAVKSDKKAFVASKLDLAPAEAKKFWPIYDQYQRALAVVAQQRAVSLEGMLSRDQPVTNPYAKQLATGTLAADDAEIRARHRLYNRLIRALPAIKAARYLQLEGKIRAVQAYDIASTIPLIH
jgi:Spy/CpxP family protein refolding chaperone